MKREKRNRTEGFLSAVNNRRHTLLASVRDLDAANVVINAVFSYVTMYGDGHLNGIWW